MEEIELFTNNSMYDLPQRRLLQDDLGGELLAAGNGRPAAWKARYDPRYEDSYIAPARIKNSCNKKKKCEGIAGKRYPYDEYILDPTTSGDKQPVIRIWYPKGSWSPGSKYPGGMLMFVYPYKSHPTKDFNNPLSSVSAALEYEVFFPSDFDCVKGGKLMGLSGGKGMGRGCGGGADPAHCFNSRIMWRRNCDGEAYLYVPEGMQHPSFCEGKGTICNYAKGVSMNRGAFRFQKGEWNKIYMNVTLNNPANVTNGILEIRHNGKRVIYYDKMNWRQYSNYNLEAVEFSTWFGGSDTTWGPPKDTHILLRNVRVWRDDDPSGDPHVVPSSPRPPVLVEEELEETPW
jgi:hypothetical protein